MGLFNANAPVYSDLNLLLQIVIIILLIGGVVVARFRRKFNRHGGVMALAVALNTLSIGAVMIPSLLSLRGLLSSPLSRAAIAIIMHSIAGIVVEVLGFWLVAAWVLKRPGVKGCSGKKNPMRATVAFWLAELLLGMYVYVILYVPI